MAAVSLNQITGDRKWDIKSHSHQCFTNNFVPPIVQQHFVMGSMCLFQLKFKDFWGLQGLKSSLNCRPLEHTLNSQEKNEMFLVLLQLPPTLTAPLGSEIHKHSRFITGTFSCSLPLAEDRKKRLKQHPEFCSYAVPVRICIKSQNRF